MSNCPVCSIGSKVVVLLKNAIEPLRKTDLLQLLGLNKLDSAKQNDMKNTVNSVLDTAVSLGFVKVINDHYMPVTHTTDIAELLGLHSSYESSSTSLTDSGAGSVAYAIDGAHFGLGSKLMILMNTATEPVKKDELMNMLGVERIDNNEANDLKVEVNNLLDKAVKLGFIYSLNNEHYVASTHAEDVAQLLGLEDNLGVDSSVSLTDRSLTDSSSSTCMESWSEDMNQPDESDNNTVMENSSFTGTNVSNGANDLTSPGNNAPTEANGIPDSTGPN